MKKTQRIEVLKNIGNTKISFISVIVFVMLGISLFVGISWTSQAIYHNSERAAVTEGNLHDLEILFPYGFEQEDLDVLSEIDAVSEIEGSRYCYGFYNYNGLSYNTVIHQLNRNIDTIIEYTGTLPKKENEIAVDSAWAEKHDVKIGDTLSFLPDDDGSAEKLAALMNYDGDTDAFLDNFEEDAEKGMASLKCTEFTVTAFASSPLYLFYNFGSAIGTDNYLNCSMYVAESAWKEDADVGYNSVLLRCDDLRQYSVYSEEYKAAATEIKTKVEKTLNTLASNRNQKLYDNRDAILADAKNSLNHADAALKSADSQLQNSKQKLNQGSQNLQSAQAEIAEQEANLKSYYNGLQALTAQYQAAFPDGIPSKLQSDLNICWIDYYNKLDALNAAKAELNEAKAEIAAGENSYQSGVAEYNKGEKDYQSGLLDYETLKENLDGIEAADFGITLASDNTSLLIFQTMHNLTYKIKYTLSLLFVLVGMLVCYSAVSRMVFDQSILTGTKKALGLNNKEITVSNLAYSVSAAIIGCIFGIGGGIVVEKIILIIIFGFSFPGELNAYFEPGIFLLLSLFELILITLTTLFACRKVLKRKAVDLLKGEAPTTGKIRFFEKWKLWQKAPLLTKTIINNFCNEKFRVLGTLIGITCCTTLIIMGVTIFINSVNTNKTQNTEICRFNTVVYFDGEAENAQAEIETALADLNYEAMTAKKSILSIDTKPGDYLLVNMIAPSDTEEFKNYMSLEPSTESDISPYEGAWLCEAFRNANGGESTQTVTAQNSAGEKFDISLDGFFIDYDIVGEMILTPARYEEIFQQTWEANCFLVKAEEGQSALLNEKLQGIDGFQYIEDYTEKNNEDFGIFFSLAKAVVGIALALSMVMAFLVILNLLTMFVAEKKRELIILRINGYDIKKARKYIYSDTIFLTVISILIASVLGSFAGNFNLHAMECSCFYFIKEFNLIACIIGIAVTAVFIIITSAVSLKKINDFNLTDINK